jgi:hypothetical protein
MEATIIVLEYAYFADSYNIAWYPAEMPILIIISFISPWNCDLGMDYARSGMLRQLLYLFV